MINLYPIKYQAIESNNGAMNVIQKLSNSTSIDQFEELCRENPDFQIEKECYNGSTILLKALDCNPVLFKYLSEKSKLVELSTSRGTPLEVAAVKLNIPAIDLLIKSGADVNFPSLSIDNNSPLEQNSSCLVNRVLSSRNPLRSKKAEAVDNQKKTNAVKILLLNGAEPSVNFTKEGLQILIEANKTEKFCLNFLTKDLKNLDNYIQIDSFDEKYPSLIEARRQIYNEKFQFFLGSKDFGSITEKKQGSSVNCLPKDVINLILTKDQTGYLADKKAQAKKMLDSSIKKICQNEILLIAATMYDNRSALSLFSREIVEVRKIVEVIIGKRIGLDS